jgi:tetratricopeptide (TPR) repeat protein
MAITITTFAAFANLVVAGYKLGIAAAPVDALKSFADIATGATSLDAAFATTGLAPVAAEMARAAEAHAHHFTHEGPARDDALALFWQVAPSAFADPATFAAAHLDPSLTADRMVAAIRTGPHARDFAATPLAEPFFRSVAEATLRVLLDRADTIAALAPALWRKSLQNDTTVLATTARTEAKLDSQSQRLARMEEILLGLGGTTKGVPEATVVELARRIEPHVSSIDEAIAALRRAIDLAGDALARGEAGSNVDAYVDATLRRLAALTAEGRLDTAAAAADTAVAEADAGLNQLLDAAIRQHLLVFDAEGAARQIVRKLDIEARGPSNVFIALRREQDAWYERGRDFGLRIDLEVSICLSRESVGRARDWGERGLALNNLGTALQLAGQRDGGADKLQNAIDAFAAALKEWTRERVPLDWARVQSNLGDALRVLGERRGDRETFEKSICAHRASLEVRSRERTPVEWAMTQMNLGIVLAVVGERDPDTLRLDAAVTALQSALTVLTRPDRPLDWAKAQANLGAALSTMGRRQQSVALLNRAVDAFHEALREQTRERVPIAWGRTQANLGTALSSLGALEHSPDQLRAAVDAHCAALAELTRERGAHQWAQTQRNLATTLCALGTRGEGVQDLELAIAAHDAAMTVITADEDPIAWAMCAGDQGVALSRLAGRRLDLAMARRARDQIANGAARIRAAGYETTASDYFRALREAEALVARLSR